MESVNSNTEALKALVISLFNTMPFNKTLLNENTRVDNVCYFTKDLERNYDKLNISYQCQFDLTQINWYRQVDGISFLRRTANFSVCIKR